MPLSATAATRSWTSALACLEARSLYRFFRAGDEETLALRGVSLRVAAGEIVAVVGPSGSGKSTLLACLAGLDEPEGGTVWSHGQRMSHRPEPATGQDAGPADRGALSSPATCSPHLTVTGNIDARAAPGRPRRPAATSPTCWPGWV